ncbi:MAG: hypothetical protein ACI97A_000788 [Planctomycetota bacterium]|jgi:hypothetical protein
MKKNLQILLLVFGLIGTVGVMYWRSSPQERAVRFLQELSEVASLKSSDNSLVRKARSAKIIRYVSDPVEFVLESIRVDRKAKHDDVSTGFLALAFGTSEMSVEFRDIAVVRSDSELIEVSAFLKTKSGFRAGRYNVETTVLIKLLETDDGLRLSTVVESD